MDNEINALGHPETLYSIGMVLKEGPDVEMDLKEVPMVEVLPLEHPDGSMVNIVMLRLFADLAQAEGFRKHIAGGIVTNDTEFDTLDYTVCTESTANLFKLKAKILKGLADIESKEEDPVPNKLCMVLCTFENGEVKEESVLFQNVSSELTREALN